MDKVCYKCKKKKLISEFPKNKNTKDGYYCYCKLCTNGEHKKYRASTKSKHTVRARCKQLKKYGLSANDYKLLYEKQNGVCAICGKPETTKNNVGAVRLLSMDHDHKTKKVRGLLCMSCNVFLGHLEKNVKYISKALVYIKHI